MRIIFLDFDGVLNSQQEVVMKLRRDKTLYWRIRRKIADMFYWGSYRKCKDGSLKVSPVYDWRLFRALRAFSLTYISHHCEFCPIACSNVQYILDKNPDVQIVVSSVWRHDGLKKVRKILARNGIDPKRVIGVTPDGAGLDAEGELGNGRRGCQIQEWLTTRNHARKLANLEPITDFVIIDDDADMEHLMHRLVQTDPNEGFMWRHVNEALKILDSKG